MVDPFNRLRMDGANENASSILFYLNLPCSTLNIRIFQKFLSLSIIVFHGSGVQIGVSGVIESRI